MDSFFIKRGDTSPSIIYVLSPSEVDLTGATVRFNMRSKAGAIQINRASAVIVTASGTPTVRYNWQAGNTAVAGVYEAEFEVTYASTAVETFPNDVHIIVAVTNDIA